MTKIKNTKKGMAKKTLSMSLVVAMLATSNVPVWAAEFSDGTDAAVTSEAEAPAVDTADEFSDNAAEAPVVADDTTDVPAAQVAEGYTVNTNMELKSVDWASKLELVKKEGVTDDAKFEILDKNTVAVVPTKVEIYSGDNLWKSENVTKPTGKETVSDVLNNALTTATTNANGNGLGLDAYKYSKQVTIKVYVEGNNDPVYETSATVKPVDIKSTLNGTWEVKGTFTGVYTGKVQAPAVKVENKKYTGDASVLVKFEDEKEAKNVGEYNFSVEGVEADGYTGTLTSDTCKYTITPAPVIDPTTGEPNVSVVVSGSTTYNGTATQPKVVVMDKLANVEIPSELYTVSGATKVDDYAAKDVTVTFKADNEKTGNELIKNNFTSGAVDVKCNSGSYKVEALDLSKLAGKYNIAIATKKVNESVKFEDLTLTDKSTGKKVDLATVFGAYTKTDASNTLVTIVTSNNTAAGTGKVIIRSTDASSTNVVNEYSASFNVVNATITPSELSFAAGTKIGTATLQKKTAITSDTIKDSIYKDVTKNVLKDETYTGSAIEPLKEAFSNLVLTNSATVTDQKLVLGTDYDIVYENNTDSNEVSKKTPTVKLVFKGNYSGTITYEFTINKAKATVTGKEIEYTAGKKTYDVEAKVVTTVNGKEVAVPEKEYTVTTTTKGNLDNRLAKGVVVFNNKNYTINGVTLKPGEEYYYENIASKIVAKNLKNCTATVEGTYVFTGESISPKLVVKDGATVLVEGTDYTVTSKTGTNAGVAHVTVTGKGNYTGTLTVDYTIAKANLANATVESKNKDKKNFDVSYTGYPVDFVDKALGSVKIGNTEIDKYNPVTKKGDYTVTWDADATEVGTYNFTITAVAGSTKVEGEYKGTFKIVPAEIKAMFASKLNAKYDATLIGTKLTVDKTGAYYTGKAITIDSFKTKYVVVDDSNKVLTEGKDYELRYKNNVDAGVATVEAYGIGNRKNYDKTGKEIAIATLQYNIEPTAVITSDMVKKISDVEYAGGLPVEPQVVIIDAKGNRLVQGVDYTVETSVTNVTPDNQTQNGGEVTIKGKGAYLTGTKSGSTITTDYANTKLSNISSYTWKVTKKDFANTTISVDKDNNVTVMNGSVVVPSSEYDVKISDDGKKVTVTAKADSKNYTGSKEITVESAKVGQPMISNVVVKGNTATPVLSGDVDGAVGYDYVIATEEDYANGRVDISKNILKTNTNFYYVQKGTYYAYCHAWKRDANGKKVFGEWSNLYKFTVTATTPSTPTVTSVKAKGNTVTVTYTKSADATGYDVVLGSSVKSVNGEKRPVDFGELVRKNVKGNTVTVTFKNVPAGTYYAGLHSFNRTSEDGKKVFSKWSNAKKVTVK